MVIKYVYGAPFNTDAVVKEVKTEIKDDLIINDTFSFHYEMDNDTVVYGLGQAMGGINKRGRIYHSYCSDDPSHTENKESLYGAHNFIIIHNKKNNKEDLGLFFDYPSSITFDIGFTKVNDLHVYADKKDVALYKITGKGLKDIVRQFREIIGQSYIPPKFAFGFMQSRWGYKCEKDITDVFNGYKNNNIPLDSICLDIDYMKDYKDFTVDKEKFSDLKAFSDKLKKEGVRLVPIIDAGVKIEDGYDVYEEGVRNNYFCKKIDGKDFVAGVWPGRTHFPDFMQEKVREWFGQKYKILTDMGIEGFWNDMNEPAIFYSDEGLNEVVNKMKNFDTSNLDINSFFAFKDLPSRLSNSNDDYNRFYHNVNGKMVKHNDIHNLYGYNMTRSAGEELSKIRKGQRTLLFSRASYIGMHRYGGIWTGDNCSWWEHIALELRMLPSLNMCGFLYSGADIGGFGCNTNRELLLRWLALGVFTPLMRNHAALGTRDQECYRFENLKDFSDVIGVRYMLLPYIYSEYIKASVKNEMYFRPLSFDYEDDERCYEIEDQLMVGQDIMIAPVIKPNTTGRMVYLPEDMIKVTFKNGKVESEEEVKKGDVYIKCLLNEVVMFIKKGHVVPIVNKAMNTSSLDYSSLRYIGDVKSGASYNLYNDDGYTTDIKL